MHERAIESVLGKKEESLGDAKMQETEESETRGWRAILLSDCMVDAAGFFSRRPGGDWLMFFNLWCGFVGSRNGQDVDKGRPS